MRKNSQMQLPSNPNHSMILCLFATIVIRRYCTNGLADFLKRKEVFISTWVEDKVTEISAL